METWLPPSGAVERTFSVGNAVRNYGVTPAGPFTAGFYLSTDTTITTADTLIGTRSFAGLAAGARSPIENTTVTVPPTVPAGSYYLGMIVDPANAVAEADEANNVASTTRPRSPSRACPDIAEWTFAPPSGSQPRTFTIYNADRNIGTAPTGPFTVGFYLSSDLTFTTSDTLIGTRQYADLAAGAAGLNENTAVTIPGSVPAGSYYLGKIMDPTNEVAESNENNNVFFDVDPITIAAAPAPDIGASNFLAAGTGHLQAVRLPRRGPELRHGPDGAVRGRVLPLRRHELHDRGHPPRRGERRRPRPQRHGGPAPVLRRPGIGPGGVVPTSA